MSYDSVEVLKKFAAEGEVTFPLLSDPKSEVIDAFGVRNQQASGPQAGIPHPMTFVVDTEGVIRAKLPGTIRRRHSPQELVDAVKALQD